MFEQNDLFTLGGVCAGALAIAYGINTFAPHFEKPDGQLRGLLSYQVTFAVAVTVTTYYLTRVTLYALLLTLLTYLIIRNKVDAKKHYVYQIILSMCIGIIPLSIVLYRQGGMSSLSSFTSADLETLSSAGDDRHDAMQSSDLDLNHYETMSLASIETRSSG